MRALFALCLAGCFEVAPEYACQRADQCVLDGVQGECVAGSCAFAGDCPSGFRYGANAGARSGVCVSDDGGAGDLAGADGPAPGACARPYIMMAVENLTNGQPSDVGEVLRFELPSFAPCSALRVGGALSPQPEAVAWLGPEVAIAARDALYVIDPDSDTISWSSPNPVVGSPQPFPVDVFSFVAEDGVASVAVAYGDATPEVTDVYVYRGSIAGDHQQLHWTTAQLGLSTVAGMTGSPTAKHLFAVSLGGEQAAAVDVQAQPTANDTTLVGYPGGTELLHSIYALPVGGHLRLAWVSEDAGAANRIRWATDGEPLGGPIACADCPQLTHVVPDPADTNAWYALCVDDGAALNGESVRRVTSGGCPKVFDGTTLPPRFRVARLGVAP